MARRPVFLPLPLAAVLLAAAAGGAPAGHGDVQLEVRGEEDIMSPCGRSAEAPSVAATRVFQGERARVGIRVLRGEPLRHLRIVVDRCVYDPTRTEDRPRSRWVRHASQRIDPATRWSRLSTRRVGGYRIRALGRRRTGRPLLSNTVLVRVAYPTTLSAGVERRHAVFPGLVYPGAARVRGQVFSPQPDCLEGRELLVFKLYGRDTRSTVGSGQSSRDGSYVIDVPPSQGTAADEYTVRALHSGACAPADSPIVTGR